MSILLMLVLEKWWWYLLLLESEHILHRLSLYCCSLISSITLVFPLEVRLGLIWVRALLPDGGAPGALVPELELEFPELRAAAAG